MEPAFLLSLPRSGSTLVQRLLGRHSEIETVSEPWVLLPLLASTTNMIRGAYRHPSYRRAFEDFRRHANVSDETYHAAVRRYYRELYSSLGMKERWFLDKTPRYSLVAHRLLKTFPDAPVIVLWRNPLSVLASVTRTWGDDSWCIGRYKADLYLGLKKLVEVVSEYEDRVYTLNYEGFVSNPESELKTLCEYLQVTYSDGAFADGGTYTLDPAAEMGDKSPNWTGVRQDRIGAWIKVIHGPIRKKLARHYIDWIGECRLELMGYDRDTLIRDLRDQPSTLSPKEAIKDCREIAKDWCRNWLQAGAVKEDLINCSNNCAGIEYR